MTTKVADPRGGRRLRARYVLLAVVFAGAVLWLGAPELRSDAWSTLTHRVGGPDRTRAPVPFPEGDPPMTRLAVVGDVGTGNGREVATAAAIDAFEVERSFDALLLLGDNVYPSGDSERLQATVFDPFAPVLDGGTDLLAVLGNHDVRDDGGDEQVAALGMPARWYTTTVRDTRIIALDSTRPSDPKQLAWLESTLAANDSQWTIVIMHHPPFSAGFHGSSLDVRDAFVPLFERYGVDLVLTGHDHDYQRNVVRNGVTYVVSGAGAETRRTGRADFTEVAWSTHHFVDLAIWPDRMELRAVNQDGRVFDDVIIRHAD